MVENAPNNEGVQKAEQQGLLINDVRAVFAAGGGGRIRISSTPFIVDIVRMVLENRTPTEITQALAPHGASVSKDTVARIKVVVERMTDNLKARVLAAPTALLSEVESSSILVLKKTIESVAARVQAIEGEISASDGKKVVSDKREDQLMKYYQLIVELRKQLEQERLKSEVVQAYKRAAADMCMIAMEFITDERTRHQFLEKVREFEQRSL